MSLNCGQQRAYCSSPRWRMSMASHRGTISTGEDRKTRTKTCASATVSTVSTTWNDPCTNPVHCPLWFFSLSTHFPKVVSYNATAKKTTNAFFYLHSDLNQVVASDPQRRLNCPLISHFLKSISSTTFQNSLLPVALQQQKLSYRANSNTIRSRNWRSQASNTQHS
jgi:hypothetical protein